MCQNEEQEPKASHDPDQAQRRTQWTEMISGGYFENTTAGILAAVCRITGCGAPNASPASEKPENAIGVNG